MDFLVLCLVVSSLELVVAKTQENAMDIITKVNAKGADDKFSVIDFGDGELFEGDIVANKKLKDLISDMMNGADKFDAIKNGQWPSGVVPYTFASGFRGQASVSQAIAEYNQKTCIKFIPRTNQKDYVEFFEGSGCFSMIGRQGGRQQISLAPGCQVVGVAVHEMMHAIGFFHEQSRRDRDMYIRINWNNIQKAMWYNFQMYNQGEADTYGEPYDKASVMHYGNYAFSINGGKTIESKASPNEELGQRNGLSDIDAKQIRKYYGCGGVTPVTEAPTATKNPTGTCKDDFEFCKALGTFCSDSWVKSNCKQLCRACASACEDKNQYCDAWAKLGHCTSSQYAGYMQGNCKKSCGLPC